MCAVWAGKQPIPAEPSEWQQFWDHFKSHDAKYVWAVANWPDWGWNEDALRETERMAGERQENKWWSFYVDVHEGQTSVPALLDQSPASGTSSWWRIYSAGCSTPSSPDRHAPTASSRCCVTATAGAGSPGLAGVSLTANEPVSTAS